MNRIIHKQDESTTNNIIHAFIENKYKYAVQLS